MVQPFYVWPERKRGTIFKTYELITLIFNFIRYTQPAWQFNLKPHSAGCFPFYYSSNLQEYQELQDNRYETTSAMLTDISFQAWNKGALLQATNEEVQQLAALPRPTLKDEYIFVRKYWGTPWATFALIIRIITLKNPIKEFKNYFATKGVAKADLFADPVSYPYERFESSLISSHPKVSIIIPTLNRYDHLKNALQDLEQQTYSWFEVIVVDQSDEYQENFYSQFQLELKVIRQKEKLLWTARNEAIKITGGEYILLYDDDSRVGTDWVTEHLKCLDFFNADISAGVSLAKSGGKVAKNYSYFRWADQFDSGNAMVKRAVFKKIGLFDEQFNGMRMGDGEFGYRAYLHGIKSISNFKASRLHLKVSSGGLRAMGSWDAFRSKKWLAPKPVPSVIFLYKKYFPQSLYLNAILIGIMLSNIPYRHKRSSKMLLLSVILTFIKSPLLYLQFSKSQRVALNMLANDRGVEMLSA